MYGKVEEVEMENMLVVIDMQNDFINGSLGSKEAEDILPKVIDKIVNFDGSVVYTRDTHLDNYLDTEEGKNLPVMHCIKDTPGWKLQESIDQLRVEKKSKIFDKSTFGSKELAQYVTSFSRIFGGIKSIEICGLCTDICVITNALLIKAFMPNTPIIVDSSCCAGVTPQSHQNALKAMEMCHITIK
jgi:nicotinamidase-related amidase